MVFRCNFEHPDKEGKQSYWNIHPADTDAVFRFPFKRLSQSASCTTSEADMLPPTFFVLAPNTTASERFLRKSGLHSYRLAENRLRGIEESFEVVVYH